MFEKGRRRSIAAGLQIIKKKQSCISCLFSFFLLAILSTLRDRSNFKLSFVDVSGWKGTVTIETNNGT